MLEQPLFSAGDLNDGCEAASLFCNGDVDMAAYGPDLHGVQISPAKMALGLRLPPRCCHGAPGSGDLRNTTSTGSLGRQRPNKTRVKRHHLPPVQSPVLRAPLFRDCIQATKTNVTRVRTKDSREQRNHMQALQPKSESTGLGRGGEQLAMSGVPPIQLVVVTKLFLLDLAFETEPRWNDRFYLLFGNSGTSLYAPWTISRDSLGTFHFCEYRAHICVSWAFLARGHGTTLRRHDERR
ncbi:unnamed protein product [Ectocarpus fasciculatus]